MIEKISYLLNSILKLDELPVYVNEKNKWENENIFTTFLIPSTALVALEIFITYIFYSDNFKLEVAFIKPFLFVLSSLISFSFFSKIAEFICENYLSIQIKKNTLFLLFFLLFFTHIMVKALLIFFPSMFFIEFFNAYIFYQSWHISNAFFEIDEKKKLQFTLIIPGLMLIISVVVDAIIKMLVPNIQI